MNITKVENELIALKKQLYLNQFHKKFVVAYHVLLHLSGVQMFLESLKRPKENLSPP